MPSACWDEAARLSCLNGAKLGVIYTRMLWPELDSGINCLFMGFLFERTNFDSEISSKLKEKCKPQNPSLYVVFCRHPGMNWGAKWFDSSAFLTCFSIFSPFWSRGPSEWLRRVGFGLQQLPNLNAGVCFRVSQMTYVWHTLKMINGLREAWKPERQALSSSMDKSSTGLLCSWQGRKGKFPYLMVLLLLLVRQVLLSRNSKYRSIILNYLHCAKEQYFWYKIMKCTVPEQQTGTYCLWFQYTIESMSCLGERLGKVYKVLRALEAQTWAGLVPWLIESWVLPRFSSNCVQTPSCWVFSISTQSSVPQPCSSLCLLQRGGSWPRLGLTTVPAATC